MIKLLENLIFTKGTLYTCELGGEEYYTHVNKCLSLSHTHTHSHISIVFCLTFISNIICLNRFKIAKQQNNYRLYKLTLLISLFFSFCISLSNTTLSIVNYIIGLIQHILPLKDRGIHVRNVVLEIDRQKLTKRDIKRERERNVFLFVHLNCSCIAIMHLQTIC